MWRPTSTAPTLISRSACIARPSADATAGARPSQPDVPHPDILLLRARANDGDKKLNAALDDLNKAIEAKPDLVDAYIERGIVFTQARRFDDAIGDLNRALELDPQNVKAYAMRASAKLQAAPNVTSNAEGNAQANDDALNDVNQALQIAANDPTALAHQGQHLRGVAPHRRGDHRLTAMLSPKIRFRPRAARRSRASAKRCRPRRDAFWAKRSRAG